MAGAGGGQTTYEVVVKADGAPIDKLGDSIKKTTSEMDKQAQAAARLAASQAKQADAAKKAAEAIGAQGRSARESAKALVEKALASTNLVGGLKGVAGVAGAVAGGMMDMASRARDVIATFVDMASEGAKLKTLEGAFNALGGSAKQLEELRRLTGGLVSDADLQQSMNLAKLFKLPEAEVPKLIKLAQGASAALGTTVGKALQDTFTAASRQSKMIADNMGIVIGDMGKLYEDFARKRGKNVKDLTDQEKALAFTQKMIAEGGRQMELANIAQGNSAMRAAASYDNLKNKLLMSIATAADGMGIWDMLGGSMAQLDGLMSSAGGSLSKVLGEAFKSFLGILNTVAKALAPAIMSVEGLGKVMHILGGTLKVVAPAVQGLLWVFQQLSSFLLDVVSVAIEGIIRAAAAAASVLDEDLSASLTKAADEVAKARTVSLDLGDTLKKVGDAAAEAAPKVDGLAVAMDLFTGKASAGSVGADAFAQKLGLLGATNVDTKSLEGLRAEYDRLFKQSIKDGKDAGAAAKFAAEGIAASYGVGAMGFKRAQELIREERGRTAIAEMRAAGETLLAEKRAALDRLQMVENVHKMQASSAEFGVDLLSTLVMEGAKSEEEALAKLEEYYAQHMAAASELLAHDAAAFEQFSDTLAGLVNSADEAIGKSFNKDTGKEKKRSGGGGRAPDYFEAEYAARLQLADEHERKIIEIETKYQDMSAKLRADDHDTRIALTWQMVDEIAKAEEEIARAKEEAVWRVQQYLMSADQAAHMQRLRDIEMQAAEMKRAAEAAGAGPEIIGGIDQKAQAEVSAARIEPLLALRDKLGGMAGAVGESVGGMYGETMAAMEEETKARTQRMADMFQTMGTSIGDTMMQIAVSGEDMRDSAFKLMGQLFGQLSTAFLAWATAESALLQGNPFLGAAAAIALGLVGSAISAFGSRGKSSGAKGGTSGMSQAAMDRRKQDKEREASVVIYNYGFSTPDQIARSVSRGEGRGRDLEGRRRATA